jgi:hypothetical protein
MRVFTGKEGDFVFLQGDGFLQVRNQCSRTRQFHLCLTESGLVGQTSFVTDTGQTEAFSTGIDGLLDDGQFVVQGHQLEIGLCQLGYQAHL